jgi:hypothetical protein
MYFVTNKQTLETKRCTAEEAEKLMELDAGGEELSWAVRRTGRCDTETFVAIHVEADED